MTNNELRGDRVPRSLRLENRPRSALSQPALTRRATKGLD